MELDNELLLRTFISESEEILAEMEQSLLTLEKDPANAEKIRNVFRGAHTLKGNASCLGMETIAGAVHHVEDYLDRLQRGDAEIDGDAVSLLLSFVDLMRESIAAAASGNDAVPPGTLEVVEALTRVSKATAERERPMRTAAEEKVSATRATSVRVATARLDRALDLTGEISIARGRLRQLIDLRQPLDEISEACSDLERLSNELQELVMKLRMVPIGPFFRQYSRSVRDVAAAHHKQASLRLEGEDVEVDLGVIEHLRNPLTHLIRNAVDHGIESPEVRQASGKDVQGTITLSALRDGGTIVIRLADDGAGLNRTRIAARARELGLLAETEKLPDQELFRFIFAAGFSTAENVTDMSGRGLGMDVVRRSIEELHGTVNVENHNGAAFTLRLPLTVAIIDGFVVTCGGESYVLPLDSVSECIAYDPQEDASDEDIFGIVSVREEPVPFVRLRRFFDLGGGDSRTESLVVLGSEGRRAGVLVDGLVGERQLVIKPLGKLFQGISALAGSAVLGDGRVAMVLDVAALLDSCIARLRDSDAESRLQSLQGSAYRRQTGAEDNHGS
ncbi:MAG TPA: chemotaxis protein CheA [Thermoanaerobaculia bacterium]